MNDTSSIHQAYYQRFASCTNLSEIVNLLQQLQLMQTSGKLSEVEKLDIQLYAFSNMFRFPLSASQVTEINSIVLQVLLPGCLANLQDDSRLVYRHRDILTELIERLPYAIRKVILTNVIDSLLPILNTSNRRAACAVIANLGYKETRILLALKQLISNNDNEDGDICLSSITWLGLTKEEQESVLKELLIRIKNRYNRHLLWALSRIDNLEAISSMISQWLIGKNCSDTGKDSSLIFTAIRGILDKCEPEASYEDAVWVTLAGIVESDPKALYWEFEIGHITEYCNSTFVIPTILNWVSHDDWFPNPSWARYLAACRLEECVRPRQLEGWQSFTGEVFALLKTDACQDTGTDVLTTTIEANEKEMAWKTLLRAGHADVLDWFNPAVTHEKNRFSQQNVMDLLACFIVDPLPEMARQLIVEEYDDAATGTDGREFFRRMAAVQMARSAASQSAFDTLLDFGFTYKEKTIRQSTDAIAEVGFYLTRHGNNTVVPKLVELVKNSTRSHQRLAAANALEVIASRTPDHITQFDDLMRAIQEDDRDPIERGLLVMALGHLDWGDFPDTLTQAMKTWCLLPERWLGGGSLYTLAKHGILEQSPELMEKTLGLVFSNGQWFLDTGKISFDWAPYIIGLLYYQNPEAYIPAVSSVLELKAWQWPVQIAKWLETTHCGVGLPPLPEEVEKSLLQRISTRQSTSYSEIDIFELLGKVAPTTLLQGDWKERVDFWMPDSRVALADALGSAKLDIAVPEKCLATLEILSTDSMYAVRRAAYRALAKQAPIYLYALCKTWASSNNIGLISRSAEACGWLESSNAIRSESEFDELFKKLSTHAERTVRETALRSRDERRKRLWSKEYLSKVLAVRDGTNDEILRTWCYGDALSRTGDDETLSILKSHIASTDLPPNARHWLRYIVDELEKNWKKVTQKWPEPWQDLKGVIEQGQAKWISHNNMIREVHYTLSRQPAAELGDVSDWRGVLTTESEEGFDLPDLNEGILEIEGNRRGRFLVEETIGNTSIIRGSGPYPGDDLSDEDDE